MPNPTPSQIRGVLLEEVVLYLLRASGYRTVEKADISKDPTLTTHSAGIAVHGRGEKHQIDAIGDFFLSPPFGHPLRLLVEAKCYDNPVGIAAVRNAVGVMKDVCEFWVIPKEDHGSRRSAPHKRFHYQYAVISTSGFTGQAQRYAFAHDIFLISLAKSGFFKPVIDAIKRVSISQFGSAVKDEGFLSRMRERFRFKLRNDHSYLTEVEEAATVLDAVIATTRKIGKAYLSALASRYPVFLVPSEEWESVRESIWYREEPVSVTITYDTNGWYINSNHDTHTRIFSFDLPPELFVAYAQNGLLTRQHALDLKQNELGHIEITDTSRPVPRLYWLDLDQGWLRRVEERLRSRLRENEAPEDNA